MDGKKVLYVVERLAPSIRGSIVMDWPYQKAVLDRHGITTEQQLEQKYLELSANQPPEQEIDYD